MSYIPDTFMGFNEVLSEGQESIMLTGILNPSYIYNVGDTVLVKDDVLDRLYEIKITKVTHQIIQGLISSDQYIEVTFEKVRELASDNSERTETS